RLRQESGAKPLAGDRAGVADALAAAAGQLRAHAGRDPAAVSLLPRRAGGGRRHGGRSHAAVGRPRVARTARAWAEGTLSEATPPALAHHFDTLEQQREAGTLGMWLFLATELMVFGGLFTAYTVYRYRAPEAFQAGSNHLSWKLATLNTVVLLTSSFTMALAVYGASVGRRGVLTGGLVLTVLLGVTFLGIKAVEYTHDY